MGSRGLGLISDSLSSRVHVLTCVSLTVSPGKGQTFIQPGSADRILVPCLV